MHSVSQGSITVSSFKNTILAAYFSEENNRHELATIKLFTSTGLTE